VSMTLMVEAMKAKVGNPGRKLVLVKLADNANDKGECWPSYQHVADQCEMGRSTVKAHIKALEEAGFLTVVERNGGVSSNKYRLHITKGKAEEKPKQTRSNPDPVKNKPGQDSATPRSDSDTPTRSNPDPRTSHSFEPVIEPVDDAGASSSTNSDDCVDHDHTDATDTHVGTIPATEADDPFLSNLFSVGSNLPAAPAPAPAQSRDAFEMHHGWQPTEDAVRLYMGRHVAAMGLDKIQAELVSFRLHFIGAKPERQGQWEKRFLGWLNRAWPSDPRDQAQSRQQKRAAVTEAIMDINDTDW